MKIKTKTKGGFPPLIYHDILDKSGLVLIKELKNITELSCPLDKGLLNCVARNPETETEFKENKDLFINEHHVIPFTDKAMLLNNAWCKQYQNKEGSFVLECVEEKENDKQI